MSATPVTTTSLRDRALTVVAAILVAVLVEVVATTLAGVDLVVAQGGVQTVGVGAVAVTAAIAALLGWALLAVLERSTRHAGTIWTAVAAVVTLLSLAGPLTSALGTPVLVTLVVAHLAVAAVTITGFRRTLAGPDARLP